MTELSHTPSSAGSFTKAGASTTSSHKPTSGSTQKTTAGGGGYDAQTHKLAPLGGGDASTTLTIGGVTLSAHAVGSELAALERALGPDWTDRARKAAKDGGSAVLKTLEPLVPAAALRLPLALDIANAYASWVMAQPKSKGTSGASSKLGHHDKLGKGESKNLALGKYGLMVDLEAALGESLGLFAPSPGQSVGVHASGAVSVEGIYVAMGFDLEAEHEDDGFKVKGAAKLQVGVGTTGENASLTETLSVVGHGDDAVEAMHMAGLAIERYLRAQQFDWKNPSWQGALSTGKKFLVNVAAFEAAGPMGVMGAGVLALAGGKIASALWGKDFEADVVKHMDDDDYGEYAMGVGVDLSGGGSGVELGVGVGYTHKTKVSNVNGAIGGETSDIFSGKFSLALSGGGFELDVSGHLDVPLDMSTADIGLAIEVAREEKIPAAPSVAADLVKNAIVGLSAKSASRAAGWIGRVAGAVDKIFRAKAMVDAMNGAGAITLSADYDYAAGELSLAVVVSKKLEQKSPDNEEAEMKVSFELGQEIVTASEHVGQP